MTEVSCTFTFPILLALFPFSRMVSILFHLDSIISSVSSVWDSDQERNSNWSVLKIHRHQKALTPQNSLRTSDPENSQTYLHFSCCSQPFLPHFAGTFCQLAWGSPVLKSIQFLLLSSESFSTNVDTMQVLQLLETGPHLLLLRVCGDTVLEKVSINFWFCHASYSVFRGNCQDSKNYVLLLSSQISNILLKVYLASIPKI